MSMKNSNDTIGNRIRDLPTCSVVPQPTALPRAPAFKVQWFRAPTALTLKNCTFSPHCIYLFIFYLSQKKQTNKQIDVYNRGENHLRRGTKCVFK
jgi:hypothetical protein